MCAVDTSSIKLRPYKPVATAPGVVKHVPSEWWKHGSKAIPKHLQTELAFARTAIKQTYEAANMLAKSPRAVLNTYTVGRQTIGLSGTNFLQATGGLHTTATRTGTKFYSNPFLGGGELSVFRGVNAGTMEGYKEALKRFDMATRTGAPKMPAPTPIQVPARVPVQNRVPMLSRNMVTAPFKSVGSTVKWMARNPAKALAGGAGLASFAVSSLEMLSSISRQRKVESRTSLPRIGQTGTRYNMGIDPLSGVRFATQRRRFGGY